MSLSKKAISAGGWTTLIDIIQRVGAFIFSILAARILTPDIFGLYAMTYIGVQILESLALPSLFSSIINDEKYQEDDYFNIAWTYETFIVNIIIGFGILAISPLMALFFNAPELQTYVAFLAIPPFIRMFQNYHETKLHISLNYRILFKVRIIPRLLNLLLSIFLILWLKNIWAFLIPVVITALIKVLINYYYYPVLPKWNFNWNKAKELWVFGKWITMITFFKILKANIDKVIVGKVFNTTQLGYYQVGGKFSNQLTGAFQSIMLKVLFPVFSMAKREGKDLTLPLTHVLQLSLIIIAPIIFYVFFKAEALIILLFGEQWNSTAPIAQIFILAAFFKIINTIILVLFRGAGNPKKELQFNIFYSITLIPLTIWTVTVFGAIGAAGAIFIVEGITSILTFYELKKFIKFGIRELVKSIILPIAITIPGSLLLYNFDYLFQQSNIGLLLESFFFGILFIFTLFLSSTFFKIESINMIYETVKSKLSNNNIK